MAYRTKDELAKIAKEQFGVELDLTKKHDVLSAEVEALELGQASGSVEDEEPEVAVDRKPKTLRHKRTGKRFPYHPIFAKNGDLEVVEWEGDEE